MPTELVAVLGTLGGVVAGGFINYLAMRRVKNHEWRLSLAKEQAFLRQRLYSELLVEAQRLVVQTREEKISSLIDLNALNGKFAEVCLVAPDYVVAEAQHLANYALTSHSAEPADQTANFFEIKKCFITAARKDMQSVLGDA